jgi:alpha-2-macroglobulin
MLLILSAQSRDVTMLSLLFCLLFVACSGSPSPDGADQPAGATDAPDVEVVAGHSPAVISRAAELQVRFTEPVVDEASVGAPLERSPISLSPGISGTARFTSTQVLAFAPDNELEPGESYTVQVDVSELREAWADRDFSFQVTVMPQSYRLKAGGLSADGPDQQRYEGVITTADVADAEAVEKILTSPLPVEWSHGADRLEHRFTIAAIPREEAESELVLLFDGAPLGVSETVTKNVKVPGLASFELLSHRAVLEGERHLELRFSDPLQQGQDLDGLVRVDGVTDLRYDIDGSVVRLYRPGGWAGGGTLRVSSAVKNGRGRRLPADLRYEISFAPMKPAARFVGSGVIIPTTTSPVVPIEVVNLDSVIIEALRVHESNVPQFLQSNRDLSGTAELQRVGKVVWRKRVPIEQTGDTTNRWVRLGLDLAPLLKDEPRGLYRLRMGFTRADIDYPCDRPKPEPAPLPPVAADWEDSDGLESTSWDSSWGVSISGFWREGYESRENPCHDGFYRQYSDHDITANKNVLVSNLGLLAKLGSDDTLHVVATDLQTAVPRAGTQVEVVDYQLQTLATATTDREGRATFEIPQGQPFALSARSDEDTAWVRMDRGSSLALGHFDVAGAEVDQGLKGFLYGERGVWRPGDDMHLTFVLDDEQGRIPDDHPAQFELWSPTGQRVESRTFTSSLGGFTRMTTGTAYDAPTGNYTAKVRVGGTEFTKVLAVESIKPNRLKIDFDFGTEMLTADNLAVDATLSSRWLHGAIARNLKTEVDVELSPRPTRFDRFTDYTFEDLTADFRSDRQRFFSGRLDEEGSVPVGATLKVGAGAGGLLTANFETRVFEPGGGFSVDRHAVAVSPHERYIGIKLPKGDKARGMLLTDIDHPVEIVAVDAEGNPIGDGEVELSIFEIHWRWWWDKGSDNLGQYAGKHSRQIVDSGTVKLKDGRGTWNFQVKYPEWGRYLIVARDKSGEHTTAAIKYIDWPGWAGRAQKDNPGGAAVLSVVAAEQSVAVGDEIALTFPVAAGSRALVSLESGSGVVESHWVEPTDGETTTFTVKATPAMAPTIYANVTLIQPHDATNDLPIRMYGIVPIEVFDPGTKLEPQLQTAEVFAPSAPATIKVSEAQGRSMTYTLAVVDEGLLGLTRFQTPDPWQHFYQREALGVRTWDVFSDVAGAYGGALEGLLAIGGDGSGETGTPPKANRFDPVVRYLGPFTLPAGQTAEHTVDIPRYIGEVRVMLVAGAEGAYGQAHKSVTVKKPLVALSTVPRVVGPEEDVTIPVSVFALEEDIKDVTVEIEVEGPLDLEGEPKRTLRFSGIGDKMTEFHLKVRPELGVGKITVTARSGKHTTTQTTEVDVRHPTLRATEVLARRVPAGGELSIPVALVGMVGTRQAELELSTLPPLNLGKRLDYLLRYPHGCAEQTTSAAFPQVYLSDLTTLTPEQESRVSEHVSAAIARLRGFQTGAGSYGFAAGGFSTWPAGYQPNDWTSSYVGHFLLEAERAGFVLPAETRAVWVSFQKDQARRWSLDRREADLLQAYRLYTLALAGAPQLGAMNRLKEVSNLSDEAAWRLAAAYKLAGQGAAAGALVQGRSIDPGALSGPSISYGSVLRNRALILETLVLIGDPRADGVAVQVADALGSDDPHNTQATATALVALARYGIAQPDARFQATWSWGGSKAKTEEITDVVARIALPVGDAGSQPLVVRNPSKSDLFVNVVRSGVPAVGEERPAANNLAVSVRYVDADGNMLDPALVAHGTDMMAELEVKNTGRDATDLALSFVVPSGWELFGVKPGTDGDFTYRDVRDDRVLTYFDLESGASRTFKVPVNAAYLGRFYRPPVVVEHMYDPATYARNAGGWTEVQVAGGPS